MASQKQVHVLVVTYPLQGHINPLLQLAKRLATKPRVKTTLAATPYTLTSIHAPGPVHLEPISDGFDEGGLKQAPSTQAYLESFKLVGSKTLTDLIKRLDGSPWPVDCVVYDSLHPWAREVARETGVRAAAFMTTSASVCSLYWMVRERGLGLPVRPEALPLVMRGEPRIELAACDLPSFLVRTSPELAAFVSVIKENMDTLEENDWVFLNTTFEELEFEVAKDMSDKCRITMVGPMLPSSYLNQIQPNQVIDTSYGASLLKPTTQNYISWLDTKQPNSITYVSFGSWANLPPQQVHELAWALHSSKLPFLWVLRESEAHKLPSDFLNSQDGLGLGLVVTWCDQLAVLAHNSVGCFVTHCGWNSTIEALTMGVPLVGVDQFSDQPTNARVIEEVWKVGVRAKKVDGVVGREEIERCVKSVLCGEEIKRNVMKWREEALKAVSEEGSSYVNLERFVQELRSSNVIKNEKRILSEEGSPSD